MPLADEAFEAHIRARSDNPPPILYRYMTVKTASAVLQSRKLRFHSPFNYNDPFDSQWDVLWPVSGEAGASKTRIMLEQACRDPTCWPPDMDPRARKALANDLHRISKLPKSHQESELQELLEDSSATKGSSLKEQQKIDDLRRRLRVLCFSTNESSILMWSHYAENHRGVVMGFKTAALEQEYRRPMEKVSYQQDFPNLVDEDAWLKAIIFGREVPPLKDKGRGWALTKFNHWEYEKEWRFVWVATKGIETYYDDFNFPGHSLVELVLGCKIDDRKARNILLLAQKIQPELVQYSMVMHPTKFELQKIRLLPYHPQPRPAKKKAEQNTKIKRRKRAGIKRKRRRASRR